MRSGVGDGGLVHDLSKRYDDRVILEGLSDRMLAGERIGVAGPNGAGKTTLLRIAIGGDEADSGEVVLGENTRVGYLDQRREFDPGLGVVRAAVSSTAWVEMGGRRIHFSKRTRPEVKEPGSIFDRIRQTRITPGALLLILGGLAAIWLVFAFTDLGYILLPG
jgi:ABC-type branched-subunit amino acid transport system ATPase component